MGKDRFVCDYIIRLNPDIERLDAAIERAEAVWDGLQLRGYGNAKPVAVAAPVAAPTAPINSQRGSWDGLPVAATRPEFAYPYGKQPPKPTDLATQIREARADLAHWRNISKIKPGDEEIQAVLDTAIAKLQTLEEKNHGNSQPDI